MAAESDFDSLRQDMRRLAYDDTLDVFRSSEILFSIQRAQVDQAQELYDALIDSLWLRSIEGSVGAQLDTLGRIVGVYPRPLQDAGLIDYFAPDVSLAAPDWAPVFVTGAPIAGQVPVGDPSYRTAIRVKIAKNHVKYGSAPELQYFARIAWGVTISVRNVGLSDLQIAVSPGVSPQIVAGMIAERTDETADHQYTLPVPTTTRILRVMVSDLVAFAPDLDVGAPDLAPVGIAYYV